jgi:peptide deformylase
VTIKTILQYPKNSDLLRKKSVAVKRIDSQTRRLIRDLKDTLLDNPGAGLAAPQIGVHERVVVVRFGQDDGEMDPPIALINPVIVKTGEPAKGFDGCLSIPNLFSWETLRPEWLQFSAMNERGKLFSLIVDGIDARLVHHEIDHLDGVLFIDHVKHMSDLYSLIETDDGEKLVRLENV